jgi:hypothetical protein
MPVVEQVGGTHYAGGAVCPHCRGALQHWDLTASEPYLEANATKYILRHRGKNGFEDLKKAISYIEKIMAVHYPEEYAEWQGPGKRAQDASPPVACPACTCDPDANVHAKDCPKALWMFPPKSR